MERIMRSGVILLAACATIAAATPARAAPQQPEEVQTILCKNIPINRWGDPAEIIQKVKDLGYQPLNIRIEKGCWEVKALDAQREVYEFYIHPISHEIVLRKHKPDESGRHANPD